MSDLSSLIADQWQTIDSAPRTEEFVLTWNGHRQHVAQYDQVEGDWVSSFKTTTKRLTVQPAATHWRPLPSPPRALQQKGSSNA